MIKFNYIIGANIELNVTAKIHKGRPETLTEPVEYDEAEIISVMCNGLDVEIDEIIIGCLFGALEKLEDLLLYEALEHNE